MRPYTWPAGTLGGGVLAVCPYRLCGAAGATGFAPGPTDLVPGAPVAAILDPTLANNGGPTRTHALVTGSPAIDAVPAPVCATGSCASETRSSIHVVWLAGYLKGAGQSACHHLLSVSVTGDRSPHAVYAPSALSEPNSEKHPICGNGQLTFVNPGRCRALLPTA
ncbi:MAG: choice-of-anchor Q domain-containing protein [Gammaproteobacteria bacterium]